jgi:hypothetical protein
MKTWKLIGSDADLNTLLKAISERFYYSPVYAEVDASGWLIGNSKGIIEGARIVKKGKRFRFEIAI